LMFRPRSINRIRIAVANPEPPKMKFYMPKATSSPTDKAACGIFTM